MLAIGLNIQRERLNWGVMSGDWEIVMVIKMGLFVAGESRKDGFE